jgi:hypothetical protein
MYFMPLFFASGTIVLSRLRGPPSLVLCLSAGALLIHESVATTPKKFWKEPRIPSEINFIAYEPAFDWVRGRCKKAAVVDASPNAFLDRFFGVTPDAVMSAAGEAGKDDRYRKKGKRELVTVYGGLPVLTRLSQLRNLDRDVCLVVREPSRRHFLPRRARRLLRKAKATKRLSGIDVYYLERSVLKDPRRSKKKRRRQPTRGKRRKSRRGKRGKPKRQKR